MNPLPKFSMEKQNNKKIFSLLGLSLIVIFLLSLCLGAEKINIFNALKDIINGEKSTGARILIYVRLPRTCAGILAGAALAASGAIIQTVLSNSLASPSTIGVNAGAGLAVAIFCAFAPSLLIFIPFAALIGAILGVLLVLSISEHTSASKITLVLAGVAVSAIFSAGIDAVITFVPDALNGYSDFRIGGFYGISMNKIKPAFFLIVICIIASICLHNELDILSLGTEQAQSLGLPAKKVRIVFLCLAATMAGAAVSFSGLIGFVGLIVPHIIRNLLGEDSKSLIIGSVMFGGLLLCGCDLLARIIFAPFQLPVGIVMALLGGPFFINLLRKRGGRKHDRA